MPKVDIERSERLKFWLAQIASSKKNEKVFRDNGKKILKRYRDDNNRRTRKKLNVLYSNTEILKSATLSRIPEPNVQRRYKDDRDIVRAASELQERALEYYADQDCFEDTLKQARDDMLLPGRGTVWIQYNAEFDRVEAEVMNKILDLDAEKQETVKIIVINEEEIEPDGFIERENEDGSIIELGFIERLRDESVSTEFVYWEDFLQSNSRSWEKAWWVARQHGLDRQELIDMFDKDRITEIDATTEEQRDSAGNTREIYAVWEIWDKTRKERVWVTEGMKDVIEVEDDPLGLPGFFPCPKPLMSVETTDTMVPIGEFMLYKDQADELDEIVNRLHRLTKTCRAVGIYNASKGNQLDFSAYDDGTIVPVNMTQFSKDGTLKQQIEYIPIGEIAATIDKLEARKIVIINEIFELTGISDIVRGSTDPRETAEAQALKGSFGNLRLRPRREPVEIMMREVYEIMSAVMANKFSPETYTKITGLQWPPQVMAAVVEFLRNDEIRDFRVDVETDSTAQPNQALDQQRAVQYAETIGLLLQQAIPAAEQTPQLAPFLAEIVKFVSNQFKAGRQVQDELENALSTLSQQQTPQDPSAALEAQNEQQRLQLEFFEAQTKRAEVELKAQEMGVDLQIAQLDFQKSRETNQKDLAEEVIRSRTTITTAQIDQQTEREKNFANTILSDARELRLIG